MPNYSLQRTTPRGCSASPLKHALGLKSIDIGMEFYPRRQPKNTAVSLWRFLDFAKYVSLLDSSSIFFPNVRVLQDPFEGALPKNQRVADWEKWKKTVDDLAVPKSMVVDDALALFKGDLFSSYVSCWYAEVHESDAMWRLYSGSMGIVIITTYQALLFELSPYSESKPLCCGLVSYIDYERDVFHVRLGNEVASALDCLMHKRKEFQHEKEFRVIYKDQEELLTITNQILLDETPGSALPLRAGVTFVVNLNNLVKEVLVAPRTPEWFEVLVRSVTRKYGFQFAVRRSALEAIPVFAIEL